MLQLLIDTATERALVGLAEGGQVLQALELPLGLHNSRQLFPALLELFEQQKVSTQDLKWIACGVGPGSYTGVRAGAAAAQGMAFALGLPLVAVSSLELYVPQEEGVFAAVLDGKVSGIYALISEWKGGVLTTQSKPMAVPLDRVDQELKGVKRLVSPHVKQLEGKLSPAFQWEEAKPSASLFAARSLHYFESGACSKTAELELLYLRKTQAEIERC